MSEPAVPALCLSCRERAPIRRGLCFRVFYGLWLAVRGGKATWAALEESGMALPTKSRRERMAQWFRQLKEGQ